MSEPNNVETKPCACKNCTCTEEKNCGCLTDKGCTCEKGKCNCP